MLERELRDLAYVKRWAIVRTLRDQSVAEHSYYVTMYANDIASYLGLYTETQLIITKRALWHDMEEILVGDIPGPHKKKVIDKPKAAMFFETAMYDIFGVRNHRDAMLAVSDRTEHIVVLVIKIADLMDSIHFLREERTMGNTNVEHLEGPLWEQVGRLCIDLNTLLGTDAAANLYGRLQKASADHGPLGRSRGPLSA